MSEPIIIQAQLLACNLIILYQYSFLIVLFRFFDSFPSILQCLDPFFYYFIFIDKIMMGHKLYQLLCAY